VRTAIALRIQRPCISVALMRPVPQSIVDQSKHLFWSHRVRLADQFGLSEQISAPTKLLPEFLFFGSTNVGKSSLLTMLMSPPRRHEKKNSAKNDLPRISKRAGFTATMSIYTVGGLMRLCDTPGYGFKSTANQGDVATKYLDTRAEAIRNAYVLLQPKRGLSVQDAELCQVLNHYGLPFKFVITKSDLGPNVEEIEKNIRDLCLDLRVPPMDRTFITSTKYNTGVDELRADLLLSSGILEASN